MALCALCHNLVYTKRSQVDRYWLPCTHTQHTLHAQKNNSNNLHFSSSTFLYSKSGLIILYSKSQVLLTREIILLWCVCVFLPLTIILSNPLTIIATWVTSLNFIQFSSSAFRKWGWRQKWNDECYAIFFVYKTQLILSVGLSSTHKRSWIFYTQRAKI